MSDLSSLPSRAMDRARVAKRALPLIAEAAGNLSGTIFAMIDADERQFAASAELIENSIAALETAARELREHLGASRS